MQDLGRGLQLLNLVSEAATVAEGTTAADEEAAHARLQETWSLLELFAGVRVAASGAAAAPIFEEVWADGRLGKVGLGAELALTVGEDARSPTAAPAQAVVAAHPRLPDRAYPHGDHPSRCLRIFGSRALSLAGKTRHGPEFLFPVGEGARSSAAAIPRGVEGTEPRLPDGARGGILPGGWLGRRLRGRASAAWAHPVTDLGAAHRGGE